MTVALPDSYLSAIDAPEARAASNMVSRSTQMQTAWSPRELSVLLHISLSTVHKRIQRDGINTFSVTGKGGEKKKVPFDSLPVEWKSKVLKAHPELQTRFSEQLVDVSENSLSMSDWQRKHVAAWMQVFQITKGMKGHALTRALMDLEKQYPGIDLTYPTYRRKLKAFLMEGAAGITPKWGKTRGRSKIDPEHFRIFCQYFLVEGGPSLADAHVKTFGYAVRQNPGLKFEDIGSAASFKRLLDNLVPTATQYYYRNGAAAWTRKYKSHIQRDPESVGVGELWVSDHHQLDVGCTWDTILSVVPGIDGDIKSLIKEKNNKAKTVFPWLTVWRDFRTGKMLSYLLHEDAPNSEHVIYSFYIACKRFGVPQAILIDNGKDYRAKAFAGGRPVKKDGVYVDLSEEHRSVCRLLGVIVHFAIPYNAKAKPVERDFRKYKEWFCMYQTGYRGGHIKERPERLLDEIKAGKLLPFEELATSLFTFTEQVLNRYPSQGKYLRGQSPDEYWDTHPKLTRSVREEELALCCMRATEPRAIKGNGIHYHKLRLDYYADWMSTQGGRKVYLRVDLLCFHTAFVFDADTNKFLGRAHANVWQADALVKDPKASERLRALSRMQGRQVKDVKALGKALDLGVEHLDPIGDAVAAMNALNDERGYIPLSDQKQIVHTSGAPQLTTALKDAVDVDKKSRQNKPKANPKRLISAPAEKPKKKKLFLFEVDRELSEQNKSRAAG